MKQRATLSDTIILTIGLVAFALLVGVAIKTAFG